MCITPATRTFTESPVKDKEVKLMERAIVRKDVVVPRKLQYLCTWGGNLVELDGYQRRLREYCSRMVYSDVMPYATIDVTYTKKSNRLFGEGLCLQNMPKKVRHFIMDGRVVDIDIINAAPTIIQQVCKLHNIETPCLDNFNCNYKRLINSLGTVNKKETKACLFFGYVAGKIDGFDYPCMAIDVHNAPWVGPLRAELDDVIYPGLKNIEKYRQLDADAGHRDELKAQDHERRKRLRRASGEYPHNRRGIFLSLLYFMEETEIVQAIDMAGQRFNIWDNRTSFQFDGMLVYPRLGGVSMADLDMISGDVHRTTGMRVRLDMKDTSDTFNLDITKIPEQRVIIDSHREAAEMMLYILDGLVYREGKDVWVKRMGTWTCDKDEGNGFLLQQINDSGIRIKKQDSKGEWHEFIFASNIREAASIREKVRTGARYRDGFGRDLVLNSAMKLLFRNGYWEFLDEPDPQTGIYGRFRAGESFDSNVMVPYDFPSERVQADIDFVMQKYFDEPFDGAEEGLKENFIRDLSRAMAGTSEKVTMMVEGARNCGKSINFQCMQYCFAGYVGSMNAGNFISKPSSDSTRDMGEMTNTEKPRIMYFSETATTESGGVSVLDGNRIKSFQSLKEGAIRGRNIYNNARNIYSLAKGVFLCNDTPKFKPADAYKMIHSYSMPNKFVLPHEYETMRHQPTFKLADPMIEQWYKEDKYRNALTWIILEGYHPHPVVPTPGMMEGISTMEADVSSNVYEEAFIYTGNPSDKLLRQDVKDIVNKTIPSASSTSIHRDLLVHMHNHVPGFDSKKMTKKSNGKHYYWGIKIRTMTGEAEELGFPIDHSVSAAGYRAFRSQFEVNQNSGVIEHRIVDNQP